MHECGVSTLEPIEQEVASNREVAWGSFYDFALGGVIPTDVHELDDLRAYTRADDYERCGEQGTATYEWFAHKDGGYIREADLARASRLATREAWLLSDEEVVRNANIAQAESYDALPEELRSGIRPTADTPQMFAAMQACAQAKLRLDTSIKDRIAVEQLWQEHDTRKQYAYLAKRTEAQHIQRFRGTIYVSSSYGKQPDLQDVAAGVELHVQRQRVMPKLARALGWLSRRFA